MRQKGVCFTFVLLLFTVGCLPAGTTPKPVLSDEGEVILYLQPVPQEFGKIRFVIDEISTIRDDDSQIPLSLSFKEVKGAKLLGRQKLLATAILPPGSYTGLSIAIKSASVQGEEGETALFIAEEMVTAAKLFEVKPRKATALFLTLSPSGAISSGIKFTPSFSLATSGGMLINLTGYVSNAESNNISVFNKKTMQVVNVIATGSEPRGMAFDQRRTRAYVAVAGDDAVEVYDILKGDLIGRIRLKFGDEPIDLALTPDGRTLVSVNQASNSVSIIDAISMVEIESIRVGEGPHSVVLDPSGFKAFVMNTLSKTISVVDLTQRTITVTVSVAGVPLQGAFNLAGDRLYVISRDTPNLAVIDPAQFALIDRIFVGTEAASITVDLQSGLVLVGKKSGGEIIVVDPFSSIFIDTIQVRGRAAFMTIDRQENTLFIALPNRKLVQKVNFTSKRIMAEIDVGDGASEVAVVGER